VREEGEEESEDREDGNNNAGNKPIIT
jgi:hypothetical protein